MNRALMPKKQFHETVNLKTLLAPIEEQEFMANYWERKTLFLERKSPGFYEKLFTLSDFDKAVSKRTNTIRVAGGKYKDILKYDVGIISFSLEKILSDMRTGATLILDGLNEHDPNLDVLCRRLEAELNHRFRTDIFLTGPNSQAFIPHYDKNDFFVLQVLGSKQWHVEKSRRELPESRLGFGPQNLNLEPTHDTFTLHQGDLAYIPRGYVHTAQTYVEPSLHVTLAMAPFTYGDLFRSVVDKLITQDEALRAALPLGFLNASSDDLCAEVPAVIKSVSDPETLRSLVSAFQDEMVSKFPIDPSQQIENFFAEKELKKDDVVGPRPGIVLRMAMDEDGITIRYGTRKITFPVFLKESLQFALTEKSYKISDVPGDLQAEEKIVFVERLLDEGLLMFN